MYTTDKDDALSINDLKVSLQGVDTTTLRWVDDKPTGHVIKLGKPIAHDGRTIYLVSRDGDEVKEGKVAPDYQNDHLRILTPSGGVHPFYWTDRLLPGEGGEWLTKGTDRWPAQADVPEYWPCKDGHYTRTGTVIPRLPAEVEERLASRPHDTAVPLVDMPPVLDSEPLEVDLPDGDGGRNTALYEACLTAFHSHEGTPAERMGKALGGVIAHLETLYDNTYDENKARQRYSSVEAWWRYNKGLSKALKTDEAAERFTYKSGKAKPAKAKPVDPKTLPKQGRKKAKPVDWLPGKVLAKGLITMLVAPTKVGKTTVTFGHLVKDAIQSGMRLIVISNETNATATYAYAYAHGYGEADIEAYEAPHPESPDRENYVMGQDGLFATMQAALSLDDGTPAVIIVESPEELISKADGVNFIGDSSNLDPVSYKQFITRIQNELIAPGGHAMVWSTHTTANDAEGKARGGQSGVERARSSYKMFGAIETQVTLLARGNIYEHAKGYRQFVVKVRPMPDDARVKAASDAGVSPEDASIPNFVLDELVPKGAEVESPVDMSRVSEGEYRGSELLELVGLSADTKDPGKRLKGLHADFAMAGYDLTKVNRTWIVKKASQPSWDDTLVWDEQEKEGENID